jgi:hypothetical protein
LCDRCVYQHVWCHRGKPLDTAYAVSVVRKQTVVSYMDPKTSEARSTRIRSIDVNALWRENGAIARLRRRGGVCWSIGGLG